MNLPLIKEQLEYPNYFSIDHPNYFSDEFLCYIIWEKIRTVDNFRLSISFWKDSEKSKRFKVPIFDEIEEFL